MAFSFSNNWTISLILFVKTIVFAYIGHTQMGDKIKWKIIETVIVRCWVNASLQNSFSAPWCRFSTSLELYRSNDPLIQTNPNTQLVHFCWWIVLSNVTLIGVQWWLRYPLAYDLHNFHHHQPFQWAHVHCGWGGAILEEISPISIEMFHHRVKVIRRRTLYWSCSGPSC